MPTTTAPAGSRVPSSRSTAPGSTRATRAWVRSVAPASAYQAVIGAATSAGSTPRQRPFVGLHDGDPAVRLAGGGGELRADPARAHDHDVVPRGEHRPQPFGVVQGAQQVHAGDAVRAGQPHRFGAGGEDEGVVRDGARPEVSRTWSPGRTPRASQPSRRVMPSASKSRSKAEPSAVPSRTALDSGGRSYGWWGSAPIRVTSPAKPRSRSAAAVCTPAMPAPTTTTRRAAAPPGSFVCSLTRSP
ncbi:hypothetical protein STENM223S_07470 [Streptomyces tendae]